MALVAEEAVAAPEAVPAYLIGNAFVTHYYHIQHATPAHVHRFYQDGSKFGRPEEDGTLSSTTTMKGIDEKVKSLNYEDVKAEIKSVDSQHSLHSGVQVFVTGYMTGKDKVQRNFAQTFFLAPQDGGGYYVLNDMFRYVGKPNLPEGENQVLSREIDTPFDAEEVLPNDAPVLPNDAPVQDDYVIEQTIVVAEEDNGEEVPVLSMNGEAEVVEEEEPVAEVVNEVPDVSLLVVESEAKIEEMPKKSYASIVKDLKGNSLPFSSPSPAPRRTPIKSPEKQVNIAPPTASLTEVSGSPVGAPEIVKSQDGEADGYSVYIKGLPYDATPALLENVFKKFGTIKNGGIQVRSKQGFCFGFVEFEEASAVHNAIEASPILLGGRSAVVEEKRSTNSRGNNRGRFPYGRGVGFRNEGGFRNVGMRGRGNYGGGRAGYSRGDFNGRAEFSNRSNNRGGASDRGGDGFQRTENQSANGGRGNRGSGVSGNGTIKNAAPRVPASA